MYELRGQDSPVVNDIFKEIEGIVEHAIEDVVEKVVDAVSGVEAEVEKWMGNGKQYIKQHGHTCTSSRLYANDKADMRFRRVVYAFCLQRLSASSS